MNIVAYIALPLITALLWRFKGMEHNWGTQTSRLCLWMAPMGILLGYYTGTHGLPIWALVLSLLLTWGSISIGHSKWQDDAIRSYWGMCWITWIRIMAMLAPFMWWEPRLILLTACSLLAWPACWLGYKANTLGLRLSIYGTVYCDPAKGSEWEELFIGLLPYGMAFVGLLMI